MRIVLDENLPRPLKQIFGPEHQVTTVQELRFGRGANGVLLVNLEHGFDVFVTADKNLKYQQNLTGRRLAIVELATNRLPALRVMAADIVTAVTTAMPGSYTQVGSPAPPAGPSSAPS